MANKKVQSIEPQVTDLVNGWLKSYKREYTQQGISTGNSEIDSALANYFSKNGGTGGNMPDAKLILTDKMGKVWPIMIEYKGYKDKLVKLDKIGQVLIKNGKNEYDYKTINSYAVNGAVHYANALLHLSSFSDVIAIGVTGWLNEQDQMQHDIGVYYVSKKNLGAGQKVDEYEDLSFLKPENFDAFIDKICLLDLSEEDLQRIKDSRDREIETSLTKLNNDIYQNETGLGENERVYLVVASIIANLGVEDKDEYKVTPLRPEDLKSSKQFGERDGDVMVRKIQAFFEEKKLPKEKKEFILRTLQNTLTTENINKVQNGESQLKRVFSKIIDSLGYYYKIGLTTDFTGKLFNEMFRWLGFSQDQLNDVVLTPPYVATLLVKLARVNKDSFVWDFATGSAGLLVAAMNEMLKDAKNKIKSPQLLATKSAEIKAKQLLGLELLSNVYMLAVLNMILMGDGSSNIINQDSLLDFNGNYGYGNINEKFPANAFVLNPPYSASGNGMIFVEKALSMMKSGYAAIIIQASAGTGRAAEYNKKILEHSTLLASIKMPIDLFLGKSDVQTYIYVFRVGEAHEEGNVVKFIDFSNDGYTRSNRRKAKSSVNLRDTDHAKERYDEVVALVKNGRKELKYLSEKDYYEGTINPLKGDDWNQTAPVDTTPTLTILQKGVREHLAWEASNILKKQKIEKPTQSEATIRLEKKMKEVEWSEFLLGDLFEIKNTLSFNKEKLVAGDKYDYVTRTSNNQGILQSTGFVNSKNLNEAGVWSLGLLQMDFFYRKRQWYAGQFVRKIIPKIKMSEKAILFFTTLLNLQKKILLSVLVRNVDKTFESSKILLPIKSNSLPPCKIEHINFDFIESFVTDLEKECINELEQVRMHELKAYLMAAGISDYHFE